MDAFHQETIPLEPVKYFAECVVKSKINIILSPAWLVSEEDNIEYSNPYDEDPRDIRTISFSPNGDVLDGNVNQKGILDIIKDYQPYN